MQAGLTFYWWRWARKKGQLWLLHNHERLKIPVRAHLGATINFTAGKVRRAPAAFRRWGLEWLWRIKEEPHLWKRYWNDGMTFMGLVFTHVIPFIVLHALAEAGSAHRRFGD